jgi:hypothetical protein
VGSFHRNVSPQLSPSTFLVDKAKRVRRQAALVARPPALVPQTDDSAEVAAWPANLHAVAVARRRGVRRRHRCRTPNSIAGKNLMTC